MLDIISSNHWKYPVYWSAGLAVQSMTGLDAFTRFDGLVYKLVPVRFRNVPKNLTGSIYSPLLFELLTTKLDITGLKSNTHVRDEGIHRLVSHYRLAFARLISVLADESKPEQAKIAAQIALQSFPDNIYPFYFTDILFIEAAYKAKLTEQADTLCLRTLNFWSEQIINWRSTPANHPYAEIINQKMTDAQNFLSTMSDMLYAYNRDELAKRIEKEAEKLKH
jgi:hypothetical protein